MNRPEHENGQGDGDRVVSWFYLAARDEDGGGCDHTEHAAAHERRGDGLFEADPGPVRQLRAYELVAVRLQAGQVASLLAERDEFTKPLDAVDDVGVEVPEGGPEGFALACSPVAQGERHRGDKQRERQ